MRMLFKYTFYVINTWSENVGVVEENKQQKKYFIGCINRRTSCATGNSFLKIWHLFLQGEGLEFVIKTIKLKGSE